MLDLHCHILPGVDDGPATLEVALGMARSFVRDGITHVTATPHCHRHTRMLRADVLPAVDRLNAELLAADIPLNILPGSEIQLTDPADYRREFEAGLYCHLGDGTAYTLLEFNWRGELYSPESPALVAWLLGRGMTPVIAHPERHEFFRNDPARLRALVDAGAWIQVTVDSLLGNHGAMPRSAAEEMLRTYPEAVLATDAHNLKRCSGLSVGYEWVREKIGPGRAEDLRGRSDRVLAELLRPGTDAPAAGEGGSAQR